MKYTKAQSEVIGLMIIVIIITIGMLFYLSYATNKSDSSTKENIKKEFVDNELSMSFVQTLVRTTIAECGDLPLEYLIKDCGLQENFIKCDGMTTCEAVNETLAFIKNNTLNAWDKSYALEVKYGDSSPSEDILFDHYECKQGTIGRRAPGSHPIPYYPGGTGTAYISLAICQK